MSAGILLTGATGYIGGRLLRRLEEGGRAVRCLARQPARLGATGPTTEVVQGDCLDEASLDRALAGVHSAYYLVHSMGGSADFAEVDRRAANNFGQAAARAGVRRIIYLGGLTGGAGSLSTHLKSRAESGDVLRESGVPIIELRASIAIGAGSLSFEMIQALVERLPVMICPRWVATLTQPIAIEHVLAYLEAALDLPEDTGNRIFEIGGPEVVSYGDMMREYARLRGLRRLLLPVPLLTPHLSGLWLALVTPAQARIGRALVEGLRNSTIVRSTAARDAFRIEPMPLRAALIDATEDGAPARQKTDTRTTVVDAPPAQAFAPIRRIGGATGWYFGRLLWSARGRLDRLLGGVGMDRGRHDPENCAPKDIIDGWTVEVFEPDRRLRLSADITLPGRGWLEFEVTPLDGGQRSLIRQTATFDPRGVLGRAYWYAVLPIYGLMFRGMLRQLAERAERGDRPSGLSIFTHRSVVEASAERVFRWHERPEALLDLTPSRRWVRIERRSGGLRDGGSVTFSMGIGPLRMAWEARHFGYIRGRQFCDEQLRGPFKVWRHTHRTEAIGTNQTLYEDRVEYAVPGGRLVQRLTARPIRHLLAWLFAQRHNIVRASIAGALSVLLTWASPLLAQDTAGVGTLRGRVTDSAGARASDVAVCVPATAQCTVSDADGSFVLSVRPGTYPLEVAAPGRPLVVTENVQVRAGLEGIVDIVLPKLDRLQQTVTVTAPLFVQPEEVTTSSFLVAPRDIAGSAGALQDVSRYVQALPGVAIGTADFRNDLIVRGGSPLENLYIVDNIEIPNINTFATFASAGGTVSILDVQMIDSVTFLTGGYPAPFGNRTSSVLQIAQREGRRDRIAGLATVGFAGAGGVVEGPIGSDRKGSWIVSARRSFLDLFTSDTGIGGVPVLYTLNGKVVYDLSARDRVWIVNLTGVDTVRLGLTESSDLSDELSNLDIQYDGWRSASGFNWQRAFRRGVGLFGVTYSRATVEQRVGDLLRNGLPAPGTPVGDQIAGGETVFREQSFEAETTVKYDLSVSVPFLKKIQAGGSVKASQIDYDAESPYGTDSPSFPMADANPFSLRERFTAFQTGAYAQATRPILGDLTVTAGARVDHYPFISATRISPRLGANYVLTPRLALHASYGQYYQQPFFLFLEAYPENRSLKPFAASHYVGGLTFDRDPSTRASIEAYRKDYRDYPVSSQIPPLSLANVGDTFAVRDTLFPMTSAGSGTVTGIEASIERQARAGSRWNGQANLALSRARYAGLDGVLRPGSFDYPVVANILGGYRLTPALSLSAKMAYLGGRPFTPIDQAISVSQRRAVYDLSRVNAGRSPDYFRLDLRVDRTFGRGGGEVSIFAGAQNITNRKNFSGYSWDRRNNTIKTLEQLGVFPILGIEWPF
ncbi:MAG: DUF2867 domain-containing protein [Acidobacteria bacterium]|nr:DUF2867 domain-containing protein [Acidobacteriota bacterium]